MTDQQIDRLIAARNSMTDVCLPDGVYADTADIDALLRDVQPGQRNDVDRLLGRTCAVLPARVDYGLSAAEVADIAARCDEQRQDAPDTPGMWM